MPDDVDKALAGMHGEFLDEFGAGAKPEPFGLAIRHDVAGGSKWVWQRLVSPQVPIVQTRKQAGPVKIEEELFAVIPGPETRRPGPRGPPACVAAANANPAPEKATPAEESRGWAKPLVPCDPAFCDVAVGLRGPLDYQLQVPPGKRMKVVCRVVRRVPWQSRPTGAANRGRKAPCADCRCGQGGRQERAAACASSTPPTRTATGPSPSASPRCRARSIRTQSSTRCGPSSPRNCSRPEEIVRGEAQDRQYAFLRCCASDLPYRQYVVTARYTNEGTTSVRVTPQIHVRAGLAFAAASGTIVASSKTCIRGHACARSSSGRSARG